MAIGWNTKGADLLRGVVERLERLRQEKKAIGEDEKVVMAEAKAQGFAPKIIRACLKAREQKPHDRQEAESLYATYMHALGMAESPPVFRLIGSMQADTASRESLLEALKEMAPSEGDIIFRMGGQPVRVWRDADGVAHADDWHEPDAAPAAMPSPRPASRPAPEVPDVDDAGAEALGREAARQNRPVIDNPFPFGDPRRARFDEGWRLENGGDGMGED